jgi:16S rRNA (cytidine1402-2'-O)-methyltransferase
VNRAITNHIKIVPIPGVSAVITALSVSGLPTEHFVFNGFLPSRSNKRKQFLGLLKDETRTMVFYESPNRLLFTLRDIEEILGNREVVVSRELTKVFEEILRGNVRKVMDSLQESTIKGEITLIVAGEEKMATQFSNNDIQTRFEELRGDIKLTTKDIVEMISGEMDIPKKRVYSEVLKLVENA